MDNVLFVISLSVYLYIFTVTWLSCFWAIEEGYDTSIRVIASFIFSIIWPITIPAFLVSKAFKK